MSSKCRAATRQFVHDHVTKTSKTTVRPYTIVEVYAEIGAKTYRGCGLAVQGPSDVWDEDSLIAFDTAYGRAIAKIRAKLEAEAKVKAQAEAVLQAARAKLQAAGYRVVRGNECAT